MPLTLSMGGIPVFGVFKCSCKWLLFFRLLSVRAAPFLDAEFSHVFIPVHSEFPTANLYKHLPVSAER